MLENIISMIIPVILILLVLAVLAANIPVPRLRHRAPGRLPGRVGRGPALQDPVH